MRYSFSTYVDYISDHLHFYKDQEYHFWNYNCSISTKCKCKIEKCQLQFQFKKSLHQPHLYSFFKLESYTKMINCFQNILVHCKTYPLEKHMGVSSVPLPFYFFFHLYFNILISIISILHNAVQQNGSSKWLNVQLFTSKEIRPEDASLKYFELIVKWFLNLG